MTANVEIAHQEVSTVTGNIGAFSMTITSGTGATCTNTAPAKRFTTVLGTPPIVTDTIALTAACKTVIASGDFTITYTAKAATSKSFTEYLDGIDLVVTYTPPAVRAQSGCVIDLVAPCDVFKVGTSSGKFYLWGTLYAPLARVTAGYVSTGVFEFRRGLVVRSVVNTGTPPADTTGGFCLGPGGPGALCYGPARVLEFTATVSGDVRLRALVRYADVPALGNAAFILSWNVIRG